MGIAENSMMKARLLLVAVLGLVVAADEPPGEDMKALQGSWHLSSVEINGTATGDSSAKPGPILVIKTNTMALLPEAQEKGKAAPDKDQDVPVKITFEIDQTKTPKTIDTKTVRKETTVVELGIYELNGDTLTVCMARSGDPRPTDMKTKDGDGRRKFVFKRAADKPKDK
jgi:uncharacterized protein (TIGR03067 family)